MIKYLFYVLFFVLSIDIWGQQQVLSLTDCIARALDANYGIRIARNEQLVDKNNINYSVFLPILSASGTQKESIVDSKRKDANSGITRDFKGSVSDNYGANINLNWTLFDGLAMFTTHNRMKELLAVSELETRMAVEELIAQVSVGYYSILVQQSLLDAAKQSLDISMQRYEIARQKHSIGSLSGLELKQTKIDLNTDSSKLVKQQELLKSAYINLNQLMNEDLHRVEYICDTILLGPVLDREEIRTLMLENNTALLMARKEQRISELDMKLAKSAYFPTVDFSAGYSFSRTESPSSVSTFNQTTGPFWGFSLNVPIFNRLETRRKIKNAKIAIENSRLSYQEVELQMSGNLAQLYNTYQNSLLMVDFETESANVAYQTLTTALDRYRLGSLSGIEFRDFQRSYLDAVTRKVDALFQAKSSEISLLLLSGHLKEE